MDNIVEALILWKNNIIRYSIHVALYILHIFIIHVSYYRGIFLPLGRLMSNIKTLFYVDKVEIIKATNREYQQTFYDVLVMIGLINNAYLFVKQFLRNLLVELPMTMVFLINR